MFLDIFCIFELGGLAKTEDTNLASWEKFGNKILHFHLVLVFWEHIQITEECYKTGEIKLKVQFLQMDICFGMPFK